MLPWLTLRRLLLKLANGNSRFVPAQRPSAHTIARSIKIASRYVPKATCLPQALATQLILIQNAYSSDLEIGVAKNTNGLLEAHAWVRCESEILIGGVHDLNGLVALSSMKREDLEDYARAA
jgi:hypothetical protein